MTLEIEDLRVIFGSGARATTVLHGVSLRVAPGECVAVVGASGAGKSVLSRAVLGLAGEGGSTAHVTAGRLEIAGTDARNLSQRGWRRLRGARVGLVLQDALGSLDPLRTVAAEVGEALRADPHRRDLGRAGRRAAVVEALAEAGLTDPELRLAQRSGDLSGGMRQRVLIASALVARPSLLVLDEPTTALDATVAAGVLDLLARRRDEGTAMLLVSHDLRAVARVADRVVVLADGLVVEEGPTAQVLTAPAHPATRRLVAAVPAGPKPAYRSARDPAGPTRPAGPPVLAATGLTRRYPLPGGGTLAAVDDVTLSLAPGRALGIVGESGSGKSTLARLLLAAERPDAGAVLLDGEPWSALTEAGRRPLRRRLRLVPQDPLGSVDPRLTVRAVLHDAVASAGPTPAAGTALTSRLHDLLERVSLPPEVLDRRPRTLSGGQRQRVSIARALAADPEVLVCDEPVSALDVTVQAGILALLRRLQEEQGVAIVLISHDLAVVRLVCDDVAVMKDGRVLEHGSVEAVWAAPRHPFTRELLAAGT